MVGVQLLARSKHSVSLTAAGRAFLEEARELIAHGQRAIDMARRASEGLTGKISVGFMGSVSYELLPRILREFGRRFPAIHVDLREQKSVEHIESLHAAKIDLGIVRVPISNAADLNMRTIAVKRFIAVLPRDHRLAASRSLRLEDLSEAPFMIFPADKSPSLHAKFLMACDEAGFSPRIAHEAWQMASMVSLVAAGMGVALLPAQVRNSPHPGVVYKELDNDSQHLELEIAATWRPDNISAGVHSILSVLGER